MQRFILWLIVFISIISCKKEKVSQNMPVQQVNNFIWKGLNAFYLWKPQVETLHDNKFDSQEQLNFFLDNYSEPQDLFENLLYKRGVVDRWSWIVEDYKKLEQLFQGIRKTTGMHLGLVYEPGFTNRIFAYVKYVAPNSPAEAEGVHRGDVFRKVNGIYLDDQNYQNLLGQDVLQIEWAQWQGSNLTDTGNITQLNKTVLQENPIYKVQIIQQNGKKIGYLMYNGFVSAYDAQLNDVFGYFKQQHIDELILDLRYNPGGSVLTMNYLASMITGQFTGQKLLEYQWHPQMQSWMQQYYPQSLNRYFKQNISGNIPINHLYMNKIYVIATKSSASASESLINCLNPYIDVIQIGTETHGKYVASITLYDSPDFSRKKVNPNHTWAMQPIVLKVSNAQGVSDFINGLEPDLYQPEDIRNLGILGNANENLLHLALSEINGNPRPNVPHQVSYRLISYEAYILQNDMQADYDISLLKRNIK